MILPEVRREYFVDEVVGTISLHFDLFENYPLLLLNVLVAKEGVQHKIRKYVEGLRQVLVQHLGIEADQLFGRECIQISTDRVHGSRDILRGAPRGAFE